METGRRQHDEVGWRLDKTSSANLSKERTRSMQLVEEAVLEQYSTRERKERPVSTSNAIFPKPL